MNQHAVMAANIFEAIPETLDGEAFEQLAGNGAVRIERIISRGHTSPESGWYDQQQNEWVIVLRGAATITIEPDQEVHLQTGDHLEIPARTRHRVTWTAPDIKTLWIAVHY